MNNMEVIKDNIRKALKNYLKILLPWCPLIYGYWRETVNYDDPCPAAASAGYIRGSHRAIYSKRNIYGYTRKEHNKYEQFTELWERLWNFMNVLYINYLGTKDEKYNLLPWDMKEIIMAPEPFTNINGKWNDQVETNIDGILNLSYMLEGTVNKDENFEQHHKQFLEDIDNISFNGQKIPFKDTIAIGKELFTASSRPGQPARYSVERHMKWYPDCQMEFFERHVMGDNEELSTFFIRTSQSTEHDHWCSKKTNMEAGWTSLCNNEQGDYQKLYTNTIFGVDETSGIRKLDEIISTRFKQLDLETPEEPIDYKCKTFNRCREEGMEKNLESEDKPQGDDPFKNCCKEKTCENFHKYFCGEGKKKIENSEKIKQGDNPIQNCCVEDGPNISGRAAMYNVGVLVIWKRRPQEGLHSKYEYFIPELHLEQVFAKSQGVYKISDRIEQDNQWFYNIEQFDGSGTVPPPVRPARFGIKEKVKFIHTEVIYRINNAFPDQVKDFKPRKYSLIKEEHLITSTEDQVNPDESTFIIEQVRGMGGSPVWGKQHTDWFYNIIREGKGKGKGPIGQPGRREPPYPIRGGISEKDKNKKPSYENRNGTPHEKWVENTFGDIEALLKLLMMSKGWNEVGAWEYIMNAIIDPNIRDEILDIIQASNHPRTHPWHVWAKIKSGNNSPISCLAKTLESRPDLWEKMHEITPGSHEAKTICVSWARKLLKKYHDEYFAWKNLPMTRATIEDGEVVMYIMRLIKDCGEQDYSIKANPQHPTSKSAPIYDYSKPGNSRERHEQTQQIENYLKEKLISIVERWSRLPEVGQQTVYPPQDPLIEGGEIQWRKIQQDDVKIKIFNTFIWEILSEAVQPPVPFQDPLQGYTKPHRDLPRDLDGTRDRIKQGPVRTLNPDESNFIIKNMVAARLDRDAPRDSLKIVTAFIENPPSYERDAIMIPELKDTSVRDVKQSEYLSRWRL
jgi:hypothetical protein